MGIKHSLGSAALIEKNLSYGADSVKSNEIVSRKTSHYSGHFRSLYWLNSAKLVTKKTFTFQLTTLETWSHTTIVMHKLCKHTSSDYSRHNILHVFKHKIHLDYICLHSKHYWLFWAFTCSVTQKGHATLMLRTWDFQWEWENLWLYCQLMIFYNYVCIRSFQT